MLVRGDAANDAETHNKHKGIASGTPREGEREGEGEGVHDVHTEGWPSTPDAAPQTRARTHTHTHTCTK